MTSRTVPGTTVGGRVQHFHLGADVAARIRRTDAAAADAAYELGASVFITGNRYISSLAAESNLTVMQPLHTRDPTFGTSTSKVARAQKWLETEGDCGRMRGADQHSRLLTSATCTCCCSRWCSMTRCRLGIWDGTAFVMRKRYARVRPTVHAHRISHAGACHGERVRVICRYKNTLRFPVLLLVSPQHPAPLCAPPLPFTQLLFDRDSGKDGVAVRLFR